MHIAFAAKSREDVDAFFRAALKAGGQVHGEPKTRDPHTGYYSAAVLDFDDNAVEAVYRDSDKGMSTASLARSTRTAEGESRPNLERGPLRTPVNNIATTVTSTTSPSTPTRPSISENFDSKALVGTLLGAAAGAAIAYVMTKEDFSTARSQQPEVVRRTTVRHIIEGSPEFLPSPSAHGRGSVSCASEASSKLTAQPRAIVAPESTFTDTRTRTSHHSSKPLAIGGPTGTLSDARPEASHRGSKALAIEAPPSMTSATTSKRSTRMMPRAPTFYTVHEPSEPQEPGTVVHPDSTYASKAIKTPSMRSISTVRAVRPTQTAARYALPQSTKTSVYTIESREMPLPGSAKTSIHEQEAHKYPLPPSTYNNDSAHHSSRRRDGVATSKTSRATRDPRDVPLPASARTSFVSRAKSPPRSAASASTVKPSTRGNIRRAATDTGIDDLDTVVPEDSISQAGSKTKNKHRRRRSEGSKSGVSRASRKPSSKVSMPRNFGRALGVTA